MNMSAATVTYHELPPLSAWAGDIHDAANAHAAQFMDPSSFIDASSHWNPFQYGPILTNGDSSTPDTVTPHFTEGEWNPSPVAPSPNSYTNAPPNACQVTSAAGGEFNRWQRNGSNKKQGCKMRQAMGSDSSDKGSPSDMTATSSSGPEELCLVCGDKASGYHYNALTCEGCKGFFRRSITRKARYYCKYGGHCDIDMYMRRKCQDCRLQKCMAIGMRPERLRPDCRVMMPSVVIPEDQCRIKREAKMKMRALNGGSIATSPKTETERVSPPQQVHSTETTLETPQHGLTQEQRELINRLTQSQSQFDLPSDEAIAQLSTFSCGNSAEAVASFQHLAELIIINVQLILDFTRHLPGFSTLCSEDQHTLLACSTEILMLRTARRYDGKTDTVILGNRTTSWAYDREAYKRAGMKQATDAIFDFSKSLKRLNVDDAEYSLLTAIAVFSDRPGLVEPKKVEDIQEVYTSALQAYVESKRVNNRGVFARLLMKLTDLRSLGSEHKEMLSPLKKVDVGMESNEAESTTTTNVAGYRMPNVRIKVEPLHGGANNGAGSQAVVSTTPLPDSNFALNNYSHYATAYIS